MPIHGRKYEVYLEAVLVHVYIHYSDQINVDMHVISDIYK